MKTKSMVIIGAMLSVLPMCGIVADTTITSKTYVDTTRQATIPAAGTNASTPGTTVVTYTGTAGQIGERGIFNMETDWDYENNEVVTGHEDDLVTAEVAVHALPQLVYTPVVYKNCTRYIDNMPQTAANCLLWELYDTSVNSYRCKTDSDCADDGSGCRPFCDVDGFCYPNFC